MNRKKTSILPTLLQYYALFCLSLLCYPFIHLYLDCLLQAPDETAAIQLQFVYTLCCFGGFALRNLLQKAKRLHVSWATDLLSYLCGLLPAGLIALASSYGFPSAVQIAWLVAGFSFFPWILGVRSQGKPYHDIFSRPAFSAYIIISFISFCIYSYQHFHAPSVSFPPLPFIIPLLFATAAYGAGLNQGNLDLMMERRGHDFSQLPPKIRRYNIRLLCMIFAAICLLLILQQPILYGMQIFGEGLRNILVWLVHLLTMQESAEPESETPESVNQSPQGLPEAGEGSPWWNLLGILFLIAILFVIIQNRRVIANAIWEFLKKIQSSLLRLFSHSQQSSIKTKESEYYVDEDTLLSPSQEKQKRQSAKQKLRIWKREKRKFAKMPVGSEKLRFGYGLAIQGMELMNFSLLPCDTPLEIEKKYQSLLHQANLSQITPEYNGIRYGNETLDVSSAIAELQSLLDELESGKPIPATIH